MIFFSLTEIFVIVLEKVAIKNGVIQQIVNANLLIQIIVEEPTEEEVYSIVLIFIVF